jgi:hypothetical protein
MSTFIRKVTLEELEVTKCDTPIKMTRANNILKYQSLNESLVQYIVQVVHSHITLYLNTKYFNTMMKLTNTTIRVLNTRFISDSHSVILVDSTTITLL